MGSGNLRQSSFSEVLGRVTSAGQGRLCCRVFRSPPPATSSSSWSRRRRRRPYDSLARLDFSYMCWVSYAIIAYGSVCVYTEVVRQVAGGQEVDGGRGPGRLLH